MAKEENQGQEYGPLLCRIITPQRVVFAGEVKSLSAAGLGGEVELHAGHESLMTPLRISYLALVTTEDESRSFVVHGGFLDMDGKEAVVLADAAENPKEIDLERAKESRVRAKARLDKVSSAHAEDVKIDVDRAKLAIMRANLRIEARESLTEN